MKATIRTVTVLVQFQVNPWPPSIGIRNEVGTPDSKEAKRFVEFLTLTRALVGIFQRLTFIQPRKRGWKIKC
jgi:hypothetical protein